VSLAPASPVSPPVFPPSAPPPAGNVDNGESPWRVVQLLNNYAHPAIGDKFNNAINDPFSSWQSFTSSIDVGGSWFGGKETIVDDGKCEHKQGQTWTDLLGDVGVILDMAESEWKSQCLCCGNAPPHSETEGDYNCALLATNAFCAHRDRFYQAIMPVRSGWRGEDAVDIKLDKERAVLALGLQAVLSVTRFVHGDLIGAAFSCTVVVSGSFAIGCNRPAGIAQKLIRVTSLFPVLCMYDAGHYWHVSPALHGNNLRLYGGSSLIQRIAVAGCDVWAAAACRRLQLVLTESSPPSTLSKFQAALARDHTIGDNDMCLSLVSGCLLDDEPECLHGILLDASRPVIGGSKDIMAEYESEGGCKLAVVPEEDEECSSSDEQKETYKTKRLALVAATINAPLPVGLVTPDVQHVMAKKQPVQYAVPAGSLRNECAPRKLSGLLEAKL